MPVLNGDHGTVISLNAGAEETHLFYTDHFKIIDSLPVTKILFQIPVLIKQNQRSKQ